MASKDKQTSELDPLGVQDGFCTGGSPSGSIPPGLPDAAPRGGQGLGGGELLAPEVPRAGWCRTCWRGKVTARLVTVAMVRASPAEALLWEFLE